MTCVRVHPHSAQHTSKHTKSLTIKTAILFSRGDLFDVHQAFPTLRLTHFSSLLSRAVFVFLERAVAIASPMWEQYAAEWFAHGGAALYAAVIHALADTCPPEALSRLSPLLFALNARMSGQARHWMVAALASHDFPVSSTILDDKAKEHFVQANANLASNQRRFLAMVQDFAQICRQQQTSDALVAYQM